MDSSKLDQLISLLESEVKRMNPEATQWKPLWATIKTIGASFKETRYPTREEKNNAWSRFQGLVDTVKSSQAVSRSKFERLALESGRWKARILAKASEATPLSSLEEAIYSISFGLVEHVIRGSVDALLGGEKSDPIHESLKRHSEYLREGWSLLAFHKGEMLGDDKRESFEALTEAQKKLDLAWKKWKDEKNRAWERHRQEGKEKRDSFVQRVEGNIDNLESRIEKLKGVLRHKISHLSDLHDKRDSARGDDFRSTVDGWIEEEEQAIVGIRDKIQEINDWIDEERRKLQ